MTKFIALMCLSFGSLTASDCVEWRLEILQKYKSEVQKELDSLCFTDDKSRVYYLIGKIEGIDIASSFFTGEYEE